MKPGGWVWLFLWELRRFVWGLRTDQRGVRWTSIAVGVLIVLMMHGVAWLLLQSLQLAGANPISPAGQVIRAERIAGMMAVGTLLMTMFVAFPRAATLFYSRSDLDLLQSSPLPPNRILTVRAVGLSLSAQTLLAAAILPFANLGWLFGRPELLWLYPLLMAIGFLATGVALLLLRLLIAVLGLQRARVAGQWLGMGLSALVMLAPYLSGPRQPAASSGLPAAPAAGGADALLALLGRAALGHSAEAALIIVAGCTFFAAAVWICRHAFTATSQAPAGGAVAAASAARFQVSRHPFLLLLRKEWRQLLREPRLIGTMLMPQLLLAFFLWRMSDSANPGPGTMVVLFFVVIQSGALLQLAAIALYMDESPALLHSSPRAVHRLRLWQMAATLAPLALLVVVELAVLTRHSWQLGACVAFGVLVATAFSLRRLFRYFRPIPRRLLTPNGFRGTGQTLADMALQLLWGVVALTPLVSPWCLLALLPLAAVAAFEWRGNHRIDYLYR